MVINLSEQHSLISNWVGELRNVDVQNDRLRFRRNLERIAEVIGFEISKTLAWEDKEIKTSELQAQTLRQKKLLQN